MKKSVLFVALFALAALPVGAMAGEEAAGCGIGKMVMSGKSGKGENIAASILNAVLIPNTLFMSTAAVMGEPILGCDPSTTVMKQQWKNTFVASNLDNLSHDAAKGEGAYLEALAEVMEISSQDKASFNDMVRGEYASLFPSADTSAEEVIASLNVAMLSRPDLVKYVQ